MNKSIIEENLLDIIQQHQNSQNMLNSSNSNVNGSSCSTDDFSSDTCSLLEEECNLNDNLSLEELILKKERLRQQTVLELVKTETSYVRDLKLIVKLFIEPVRSKISIRDYHDVFGNTERLLNLHREVLAVLEGLPLKPPNQQNIGEVLCNFFNNDEYNNLYQSCCSHQIHCNESFEKLKSTSKVFANCVDEASKNYLIRGLSYQMLIIKPIQRITKYPLLIKSLLENTSSEFSDYKYLQASMQKINDVLEDVNYKKKLADEKNDNDKKLKEIESSLEDTNITNNSNRRFIKEGLASKKIDKELLRLILCSDVMILAKNKTSKATVKQIFQLKNILVRDGIESLPGFTQGFELIVIEKKEKIFSLFFQSESEKKEWFQQIYSMTNQVNESQTLLKYKWFLKKSSSFIGSNGVSSASSTPPFSIDISSLSPSTSKESSPKSESPSYSHTVGTSHGRLVSNPNNTSGVFKQPTSTSNGVVPNGSVNSSGGSLRDRKPPPPPPRVQDIFKKSNESTPINCRSSSPSPPPTSPFILDSQYSPPIFSTANGGLSSKSPNSTLHIKNPSPNNTLNLKSTNPSPNSTLNFKNTNPSPNGTLNLKNPSPTNTLKLSTSGNGSSSPIVINSSSFSRASSLPSFNQTDEDVKPPTPKKMPSTISSIPQSFTDQNSGIHTTTSTPSTPTTVSASKPMLPPRNYVQDDQSENKQQQQQHFEPISKLTKSNSNNKLLPPPLLPPPPLVPPPPIMNPSNNSTTIINTIEFFNNHYYY
ncbi:hypothetical protein DLAC_11596 [Tieghemostelium lacteum]|uniref:Pleckstrin (PH) domain-containing protein n=1 Tax=Tieghemostelium lacteum TaxID=361077 RepID=A0A151ZK07_TIELA|nr:hypothetical protein DLAC_11596 [Tieghemostelium lacteum]|eukprot:KYQ94332.1 hypothetical protein DLAC_11596 [Tieghemostelium lacteum]